MGDLGNDDHHERKEAMIAKPVLAKVEYEGKTTFVLATRVPVDTAAALARIGRSSCSEPYVPTPLPVRRAGS